MPNKSHIFLIGIGGIGMSSLARYFLDQGAVVGGYDRVKNSNCIALEGLGISILYEDIPNHIPSEFRDREQVEIIYTPAIPKDQQILNYYRSGGFDLNKRAERLGIISKSHQCLAVAGTHGKTTTSCLLAHLMNEAGKEPTAFLGGIAVNYQSNFISGRSGGVMIAEADEYDRSFLQLSVDGAIITSTDSDHLDIYESGDQLRQAFGSFANAVEGPLLVHTSTGLQGTTYAVEEKADYQAENVRIDDHRFVFDLVSSKHHIKGIRSALPGRHNIENSVAAAALALEFGLKEEEILSGIDTFRGIERRFEYHITHKDLVYIDDYAHHPAEIKAIIMAVRELYPERKLTGIFQPHLFSRTQDFAEEFAHELSALDELILMDIYPARERPIPGVNSSWLLEKVDLEQKSLMNKDDIIQHFSKSKPEVILTLGAGDIDRLVQPLKLSLLQ